MMRVVLNEEKANALLNFLADLPYRQAAPVIELIQQSVEEEPEAEEAEQNGKPAERYVTR